MYINIIHEGDIRRTAYRDGIENYIKRLKNESYAERERFMPAENFADKIEDYRLEYVKMLGIDRIRSDGAPVPTIMRIGEDEDAIIYRTTIYITKEIPQYGLLFVPHGIEFSPLIVVQHGGGGTPELCSDMNGANNYNHIARRFLRRGATVFAPQLMLWNQKEPLPTQPSHAIPYKRQEVDNELKRFGMSITGLEVKGIMNAITFICELPFINKESIAITGISYGGYFTLYTMAADTRIKAGYSNACFNDRNAYPWRDFSYFNCARTFHDAEVAALCAPRKIYVAVGKEDTVFDYRTAEPEAERAKKYFTAMGCPENFIFDLWDGGHTVSSTDEGFDFIFSAFEK